MTNTLSQSIILSGILCGLLGTANIAFGMELDIELSSSEDFTSISQPTRTLLIQSKKHQDYYKIIPSSFLSDDTKLPQRIHYPLNEIETLKRKKFQLDVFSNAETKSIITSAQKKGRHVLIYHNENNAGMPDAILWLIETQEELQKRLQQEPQQQSQQSSVSDKHINTKKPCSSKKDKSYSLSGNNKFYFIGGGLGLSFAALLIAIYGYNFSPSQFFKNLFSNPSTTA